MKAPHGFWPNVWDGMGLGALWRWLARVWCSYTHGGGTIERDPCGRINWQCIKCGRWADPVPLCEEAKTTDAAIQKRVQK